MDIETLRERAAVIRQVRRFFDEKGYLELDTPLLSPDLIPESCLEVFRSDRVLPSGGTKPHWLVPSPEIWMKKTIARHRASVYQICKCFRNGESSGFLHSPEFTMLEYYTMEAGYMESLALTEELFAFLAGIFCESSLRENTLRPPFERISVAEAFDLYAGFDLFAAVADGTLEDQARRLGLDPPAGTETGVLYDLIFIHAVEPNLKREKPVALLDYPAFVPCLAKPGPDGRTVERWELYHNGIELANCFSEETDAGRVKAFFQSEAEAKERSALIRHAVDPDYWKHFSCEKPFPRCSGVAMGVDRLIMILLGRSTIDSVLPFPME